MSLHVCVSTVEGLVFLTERELTGLCGFISTAYLIRSQNCGFYVHVSRKEVRQLVAGTGQYMLSLPLCT